MVNIDLVNRDCLCIYRVFSIVLILWRYKKEIVDFFLGFLMVSIGIIKVL